MKINFKLRRPKYGHTAIFTDFNRKNIRYCLFPGKTVQPKLWNKKDQRVKKDHPGAIEINQYLVDWSNKLEQLFQMYENKKEILTKQKLQQLLDEAFKPEEPESKELEPDFIDFYDRFIETHQHYAASTISVLQQNKKHLICALKLASSAQLKEYESLSYKKKGKYELKAAKRLPFENVNKAMFQDFRIYLQNAKYTKAIRGVEVEDNYKNNYQSKHIKQLKQIISEAIDENLVVPFSTKKIKAQFNDADCVYNSLEELQAMADLELEGKEEVARDLFILDSYTSMRLSELKEIVPHNFTHTRKEVVYKGIQIKTGATVEFPLHKTGEKILRKYGFKFPNLSDQDYRELIKVVAEKAGITQLVRQLEIRGAGNKQFVDTKKCYLMSAHTGRRNFATNGYLSGVPISSLMAFTGHTQERMFLNYVRTGISIKTLSDDIKKLPGIKERIAKLKLVA